MTYITLALIMIVVLLVIPYVISKKTGKSIREVLVGKRNAKENGENAGASPARRGRQKNGNRNDILQFMSSLVTFSRKNDCALVMPGTLKGDSETAALTAVLVMPARVVGVTCFGYGGTVLAKKGEKDWVQTLNGERKQIKSPLEKNEHQLALLKEALKTAGYENVPAEVLSVFTSPKVELMNAGKENCYTVSQFFEKMKTDYFTEGNLNTKEIGGKLQSLVVKE